MSEPAINHVRPCITELYHHIKLQSLCIALFLRLHHIYAACCIDNSHMYMTYTRSACICTQLIPLSPMYALVDDIFELPFSVSFCYGCFIFFTHFCRCPFSSELELWASIFSNMSPFLTSSLLLAMLCEVRIMDFLLVFQHSWDLWPNPLQL